MKEEKEAYCPYESEELIHFKEGLFGFEQYRKFLPLPLTEGTDAVLSLLSTEDDNLSFVIMNPFLLMKDYVPVLPPEAYTKLGTKDDTILSYYVICVVGDTTEESTVNLKCPIVVNTVSREAIQVILESDTYQFRHALGELKGEEV